MDVINELIFQAAASPWLYLVMFATALVDGFFPPVPSETVLVAAAAVAVSTGSTNILLLCLVAAVGAMIGDNIAYAIGRAVGPARFRWMRHPRIVAVFERAQRTLRHRGAPLILGARYIPVGRVAVNMSAGALGYPWPRFLPLSALAGATWAIYSAGIGILAGRWLKDQPLLSAVLGVVVAIVLGIAIDRIAASRRRRRELTANEKTDESVPTDAHGVARDAHPEEGGSIAPDDSSAGSGAPADGAVRVRGTESHPCGSMTSGVDGMVYAMVVIKRGDELGEEYRRRITEVYVRSFAEDFVAFSRDTDKLAAAFEHMLLLKRFYIALVDGEPAGLASLTGGDQTLFAPRLREIRHHLGLARGLLGYVVIRSWFMRPSDDAQPGLAEIGFVATEPAHQGRGVATALLSHLLAQPGHHEYLLEDIKDTNAPALSLYAKLGFTVYKRRKVRFARRVGFTELVSMKLAQDPTSRSTADRSPQVF
ncbi:GNAT family N-acetyltransferase [Microbacterium sp. A82]|uniref:GNAT family N-acetyltransferase n=1 Tax=Microbacterium sp. A82 TaxID=3450452 RepID=UPI003F347B7C